MRFSIVVPSFNQGPYLRDCLESLISQRDDGIDLEILVIDGGSIDESREIIENYANRLTHWESQPDRGQTHALIKGFARSTGEVMGWLNSDDMLMPGALATVARTLLEQQTTDVVYGNVNFIDKEGCFLREQREIDFDLDIMLWSGIYIPQPSTFWRRSLWERSGGLDESLVCGMDYDLWLKFAKSGAHYAHLCSTLSAMRQYPEQKAQRLHAICVREKRLLRDQFLGRSVGRIEHRSRWVWHKTRRICKRLAISAYW